MSTLYFWNNLNFESLNLCKQNYLSRLILMEELPSHHTLFKNIIKYSNSENQKRIQAENFSSTTTKYQKFQVLEMRHHQGEKKVFNCRKMQKLRSSTIADNAFFSQNNFSSRNEIEKTKLTCYADQHCVPVTNINLINF